MNFSLLDRLGRLRRRLADLGGLPVPGPDRLDRSAGAAPLEQGPVDLLVTHCEVSERHGTGVLLRRLFLGGPPVASIRALDLYGGEQELGTPRVRLSRDRSGWRQVVADLVEAVGHLDVRRILCVPYAVDDVELALAAREVFGAPMCTWVMDDQNIEADGLPDALLRRLFDRSNLLLAISTELRRAYQAKFGGRFALAPPAVTPAQLLRAPVPADEARRTGRHGTVFGNVWSERWLQDLLEVLDGAGLTLDWHSGHGTPWHRLEAERLRRAGVRIRPHLPEAELVAALRASPFALVPTGSLEGEDTHRFLARLSLPSRIPFLAATAGTPVVLLGHPDTAAARFVVEHDLGEVVPYRREALVEAVEVICRPEAQARHRAAAASLAPALSADGMADWIWRSLEAGRPIDDRFDPLERTP